MSDPFNQSMVPVVGNVFVSTNTDAYRPLQEWAAQFANGFISISDTAPPGIKEQALAYRKEIIQLFGQTLGAALIAERTHIARRVSEKLGHAQLTDLILE